jgi:hypothetical protein
MNFIFLWVNEGGGGGAQRSGKSTFILAIISQNGDLERGQNSNISTTLTNERVYILQIIDKRRLLLGRCC